MISVLRIGAAAAVVAGFVLTVGPVRGDDKPETAKIEKRVGEIVDVKVIKSARDSWVIDVPKDSVAILVRDDKAEAREKELVEAWKKENPGPRTGGTPKWYCFTVARAGKATFEVRWKDLVNEKTKTYKYEVLAK